MKICISFYVMVVIAADKLMISQFWLKHKASLSCLCCDKDPHARVRMYMYVHVHVCVLGSVYVGVLSLILQTLIMIKSSQIYLATTLYLQQ